MKKYLVILCIALVSCVSASASVVDNAPELVDGNIQTFYAGVKGVNQIVINSPSEAPILSYKVYSSGELPIYDPFEWKLKGSNDGKTWTVVDTRTDQVFCSRFQEILCVSQNPASYKQYMLETSTASKDTVKIAEIMLFDKNLLQGWENFKYPKVNFTIRDTAVDGSKIYQQLVQNPDEYVKYHTQKVAEILYYSDSDPMVDVQTINYSLTNSRGVSSKSGNSPHISIVYSTRHIENSAKKSLDTLDFETRGVLYHELVHGYQYEPKGCGDYGSSDKVFWANIEGIADAVRAEAGLFDWSTRKPGGTWMDGYRTTGFFIQWLTTKDPNAIRKFHATGRDLEVWSFDAAIKAVFGTESSIEGVWEEYQTFLNSQSNLTE